MHVGASTPPGLPTSPNIQVDVVRSHVRVHGILLGDGCAGEHQWRFRFGEFLDDLTHALLVEPTGSQQTGRVGFPKDTGHRLRKPFGIPREPAIQQQATDGGQKLRLRAGAEGQPAIGGRGRDGEARLGLHELAADLPPALAKFAELPRIVDRRGPAAEEVGAHA